MGTLSIFQETISASVVQANVLAVEAECLRVEISASASAGTLTPQRAVEALNRAKAIKAELAALARRCRQ